MNRDVIKIRLEENGIFASPKLPDKLAAYMKMLEEWNARMDLTAALPDSEILDRHFIDSLTILKTDYAPEGSSWIDVGTGAGFPGLVLAMARPDFSVMLLDAQQKRLNFLDAVISETGITNAITLHGRAEDFARKKEYRERFDLAVARAVAPLNVLCEYLLPFVRIGGCALCWKGPALKDEIESGKRAAFLLGGKLETPVLTNVTGQDWHHIILPVRKVSQTAANYPRKAGIPKARPLG